MHLFEYTLRDGVTIQLAHSDITQECVDAIVNAANRHLQHGGGVAVAIVRRGGPQIQTESNDWVRQHGPVTHDRPAFTSAGNLRCRFVIHAVGPIWGEGDEDAKLTAAVSGSLHLADDLGLSSIALPAISTGIFGFPKAPAARVILIAVQEYFTSHPASHLQLIRLSLLDQSTLEAFSEVWQNLFHQPDLLC